MHRITKFALHSALALAAAGLSASAVSAAHYFKFGALKGEQPAAKGGKEKWIELESWSWGETRPMGGAGGGVRVAAGDVNGDGRADIAASSQVASPRDAASGMPTGRLATPSAAGSLTTQVPAGQCSVGKRFPGAVLDTPTMRFELENVLITSCSASGSGGGSPPMEEISMNYGTIKSIPPKPGN